MFTYSLTHIYINVTRGILGCRYYYVMVRVVSELLQFLGIASHAVLLPLPKHFNFFTLFILQATKP